VRPSLRTPVQADPLVNPSRDRGQLDLRVAYCAGLGRRVLCSVRHWVVPGVGREANVHPEG